MRERQFYTPEQQGAIADILSESDAQRNDEEMGHLILTSIHSEFGGIDLAEIERIFRARRFNSYLLAVPRDRIRLNPYLAPFNHELVSRLPSDEDSNERPYVLSMCPYGIEQVWDVARVYELSYDPVINFANLKNTGFLVPKPGSQLAMSLEYQNN